MTKRDEIIAAIAEAHIRSELSWLNPTMDISDIIVSPLDITAATAAFDAALRVMSEPDPAMVEAGCSSTGPIPSFQAMISTLQAKG